MANWPTMQYPHERSGGYLTEFTVFDAQGKKLFKSSGKANLAYMVRCAKEKAKNKYNVTTGTIKGTMLIGKKKEPFERKF
jgi:hypothetical protein